MRKVGSGFILIVAQKQPPHSICEQIGVGLIHNKNSHPVPVRDGFHAMPKANRVGDERPRCMRSGRNCCPYMAATRRPPRSDESSWWPHARSASYLTRDRDHNISFPSARPATRETVRPRSPDQAGVSLVAVEAPQPHARTDLAS